MIFMCLNGKQKYWDDVLPEIELACTKAVQQKRTCFTPSRLFHGGDDAAMLLAMLLLNECKRPLKTLNKLLTPPAELDMIQYVEYATNSHSTPVDITNPTRRCSASSVTKCRFEALCFFASDTKNVSGLLRPVHRRSKTPLCQRPSSPRQLCDLT